MLIVSQILLMTDVLSIYIGEKVLQAIRYASTNVADRDIPA